MVRQYIGARYVPKFFKNPNNTAEWLPNTIYEPLTIVTYGFNSYTSKKIVPASVGDPSNNPDYWVATANYNGQIAELTDRVDTLEPIVDGLVEDVANLQGIPEKVTTLENARNNRKFLLLADSYGMNPRATQTWTSLFVAKYPDTVQKSISSIGFATSTPLIPDFNFLGYLKEFNTELNTEEKAAITDIVVCGGWNDARGLAQSAFDVSDLQTAIINFYDYAEEHFPNAIVHIGFIGWQTGTNAQPEATLESLNNACLIYQNTRYKNLHVLDGVSDIMHNSRYMDSSGFHPNDEGASRLFMGIAGALYGGFTCETSALYTNSDFTAASGMTITIIGGFDIQGSVVHNKFILSVSGTIPSDNVIATFSDFKLPWCYNSLVRFTAIDYSNGLGYYLTFDDNGKLMLYPHNGQTSVNLTLIVEFSLNNKYC